jgi:hypothetical protein
MTEADSEIEDFDDESIEKLFESMMDFVIEMPEDAIPDKLKKNYDFILGEIAKADDSDEE